MKKVKRFLTALLCVCVLAGVMAPAASAVTVLTIINLTVDAPVAGRKPATTASVPSHARSAVQKVEWSGQLNTDGTFKAGVSYKVTITLGIKKGEDCKFSDKSITAKVNTKEADEVLWYANDKVEVIYTFPKLAEAKAPTALQEAKITLTAPEAGKTPATTAKVPSGADYTVKKVEWDGSLSGGKFKENTSYTAYVTLGIKSGKNVTFSDKGFDAYVNGQLMDEIIWNSDTEIVVYGVFEKTGAAQTTAPTVIKEAKITLTAPEVGKTPATTAKVSSSASYTVKKVEWKGSLSSGKFKENTEYTAYITLGIRSGKNATFSDKTFDADVNGYIIDEITWNSPTEIVVPVEFERTGAATTSPTKLNKIQLTIDAPAAMKKPATTASLPSTARSTVEKVKWSGQLDTDGTFMARIKYKVTVTMGIKAGSNCIFSDKSINATVNGKTADEVLWYSNDKVEVIYTFPAFGTGNTVNTAYITMDGPAVGEKPATTAHLASTDSTYVSNIRWEGALDSSGRFQGGTEYTAYLTLRIKDEYKDRKFSSKSFDAYVNGTLIDEVTRVSDREIIIPVEFTKTPGSASVPATNPNTPVAGFTDVKAEDYFAQPVTWAVNNKITSGTSATTFSPSENCTQAQILTFLWRATGSPEPKGTMAAEGFDGTEYYYKAALWAAERNMIEEGNFNPDTPCTRAMAVTYMWNYAGSPSAASTSFTDVSANAAYAQAVSWAVEQGVTAGIGGNQFAPSQICNRGQIVSFLYRAFAR